MESIFQNGNNFTEKRKQLIENLRKRGINDEIVLNAMGALPREWFVNPAFINRSYEDSALPIECNQTISQPYTVAYMTSMLRVKKDDKVLEIGTGSGYQACILQMLGAKVFTIERIPELYERARNIFKEYNFNNINTRLSDGTLGWREFAPYDGIIVTAAAPRIPRSLMEQLAIGGRMVVPVGEKDMQTMYVIQKVDDKTYDEMQTYKFKFVPLIGKDGWQIEEY